MNILTWSRKVWHSLCLQDGTTACGVKWWASRARIQGDQRRSPSSAGPGDWAEAVGQEAAAPPAVRRSVPLQQPNYSQIYLMFPPEVSLPLCILALNFHTSNYFFIESALQSYRTELQTEEPQIWNFPLLPEGTSS